MAERLRLKIRVSRAEPSYADAFSRGLRRDQEGTLAIQQRACVECTSADADLPVVQESGTFTGWICRDCDRRLRHRRGGWKKKVRRTVRRYVG